MERAPWVERAGQARAHAFADATSVRDQLAAWELPVLGSTAFCWQRLVRSSPAIWVFKSRRKR